MSPQPAQYRLTFTESYNRRAAKWLKKHLDLRHQYLKTMQLMELNLFHPSLRLHALKGRLAGVHSVSINLSHCTTLEFLIEGESLLLLNVGDHDRVC